MANDLVTMDDLTFEQRKVAMELGILGKTRKKVAEETGIPIHIINKWCQDKDFIAYKNKMILDSAEALKAENISLLTKMINAKTQKIEDADDGDYANLSNKDIASLIELRNSLIKDEVKEETSTYAKKLEELLVKSSQKNVIDVTPKGE